MPDEADELLDAGAKRTGLNRGEYAAACIAKNNVAINVAVIKSRIMLYGLLVGEPLTDKEIAILAKLTIHRSHVGPSIQKLKKIKNPSA